MVEPFNPSSISPLRSNMVILAIGVVPDTAFLRNSGLELGSRGHIIVNDRLEIWTMYMP